MSDIFKDLLRLAQANDNCSRNTMNDIKKYFENITGDALSPTNVIIDYHKEIIEKIVYNWTGTDNCDIKLINLAYKTQAVDYVASVTGNAKYLFTFSVKKESNKFARLTGKVFEWKGSIEGKTSSNTNIEWDLIRSYFDSDVKLVELSSVHGNKEYLIGVPDISFNSLIGIIDDLGFTHIAWQTHVGETTTINIYERKDTMNEIISYEELVEKYKLPGNLKNDNVRSYLRSLLDSCQEQENRGVKIECVDYTVDTTKGTTNNTRIYKCDDYSLIAPEVFDIESFIDSCKQAILDIHKGTLKLNLKLDNITPINLDKSTELTDIVTTEVSKKFEYIKGKFYNTKTGVRYMATFDSDDKDIVISAYNKYQLFSTETYLNISFEEFVTYAKIEILKGMVDNAMANITLLNAEDYGTSNKVDFVDESTGNIIRVVLKDKKEFYINIYRYKGSCLLDGDL